MAFNPILRGRAAGLGHAPVQLGTSLRQPHAAPGRRLRVQRRHRFARLMTGIALAATLASCGDDKPDSVPQATATATATTKAPAWQADYSPEEISVFREALATLDAYTAASKPYWDAGKATPAAKRVFKTYTLPWEYYWDQLQKFEQAGIRQSGSVKVLDVRATRIKLSEDGASVTIVRCVDYSDSRPTQNGEPLSRPFDGPQLADAVLSETKGRWYVTPTATNTEDRPCAA